MVSVTPDSGTILHERLAVKAGVKIRRTGTDISNANGGWLTVAGEADIRIPYDKYIHETTAPVSSDVNYNLLVAWHDLQFINVLSPTFPECVSATMSESVKEQIVDEFPEVFRDTLTEEPMRVPEMWIEQFLTALLRLAKFRSGTRILFPRCWGWFVDFRNDLFLQKVITKHHQKAESTADLTSRTKELSVFTFFSKWYISAPGTARTLKTPPS